jgi:hypothetical protein
MAPEQSAGGPVDHPADLFWAGVLLFEMLTGTKPFLAKTLPRSPRKSRLEHRRMRAR